MPIAREPGESPSHAKAKRSVENIEEHRKHRREEWRRRHPELELPEADWFRRLASLPTAPERSQMAGDMAVTVLRASMQAGDWAQARQTLQWLLELAPAAARVAGAAQAVSSDLAAIEGDS